MTGQTPAPESPHLRALRNLNDLDLGALAADAGVDLVKAPAGQIGAFLDAIRESGPGVEGDLREACSVVRAKYPLRGRLAGWGADANLRETLYQLAHLGAAVRARLDALAPADPIALAVLHASGGHVDTPEAALAIFAAWDQTVEKARAQRLELEAWGRLATTWAPRPYHEVLAGPDTGEGQRKRLEVKLREHWRLADLEAQLARAKRVAEDRTARRDEEVREATREAREGRDAVAAQLRDAQRELGGWRRIAEDAIRAAGFMGELHDPAGLDHATLRERLADLAQPEGFPGAGLWSKIARLVGAPEATGIDASARGPGSGLRGASARAVIVEALEQQSPDKWRRLARDLLGSPGDLPDGELRVALRVYVDGLIKGSADASDRLQTASAELARVRAGTEREVKDLASEIAGAGS